MFLLKLLQVRVKVSAGLEDRLEDRAEGRRVAQTNVPFLFGLLLDLLLDLDLDRVAGTEWKEVNVSLKPVFLQTMITFALDSSGEKNYFLQVGSILSSCYESHMYGK